MQWPNLNMNHCADLASASLNQTLSKKTKVIKLGMCGSADICIVVVFLVQQIWCLEVRALLLQLAVVDVNCVKLWEKKTQILETPPQYKGR